MTDIIFAGFGGQGVLTAGLIMAKTAMDRGENVTWIPSYGSEMRGGTANCSVRISGGKIPSPFIDRLDVLVAMNIPSVVKFMPALRPGGALIVNSTMVPEDYPFRGDISVTAVPATRLAKELGSEKVANIVILGALARSGALYDMAATEKGVADFFAYKGKKNTGNPEALSAGFEQSRTL